MAPRSPPSAAARWAKPRPANWRVLPRLLLLISAASLLLAIGFLQTASVGVLRRANALGRQCAPGLEGRSGGEDGAGHRRRIAMVSFSDEGGGQGRGRERSFSGVGKAVAGNKQAYAARMGYVLVDAGGMVDHSRPPSWSKILAVRSQLPHYDWVFWNDAESILYAAIGHANLDASPDLVVTEDTNGVNAGVFFVRRSEWSDKFLQTWWNQTSFVRFGSTKSGDNDALKHLLRTLPAEELRAHVAVSPAQCLFNSYPWVPTLKSLHRLFTSPRATWNGVYSDGDFLVHLAGLDDKKKWVSNMLDEMRPV
ncbi:galactosyl transferase GMA12/MNN10 family [Musa troglodytarum]|uniref:Galactosyl transferase GMA12/MNN10 family n=1 Tax=Musa troglodytarum TaxID=320322 RepID=A0A9E7FNE3_9LILI|nr:galactosyl transferase GMA12/MNN10 family [Musa troglodytarum]